MMHFESAKRSVGIPLSGVPMISSMTPAAVFMRLTMSVSFLEFSASVFLSNFATLSGSSLR